MGFAIIQLLPIIFIHMALEKKNRKLKTALFVGALVVVFVLLAILMVQTSSQKNAINSRADETCKTLCKKDNKSSGPYVDICNKACDKQAANAAKRSKCIGRCRYQPTEQRKNNCEKKC